MKEILETLKNANTEGTRAPYWVILDPSQNMACDIHYLASQITGLFFSRQNAKNYLEAHRYNFSGRAHVYCLSGYRGTLYNNLWEEIEINRRSKTL